MASQRRTKNFATDPQTPMFLYTILKQLDLRSINWNEVADSLSISNGHAARMRYSRMRTQFESLSNAQGPSKPKKEKTGESKSSRSKAKKDNNKRLLVEEENERLANQQTPLQHPMAQDCDPKKIKLEPQGYVHPWNPGNMYTGYASQAFPGAYYRQPYMKTEPLTFGTYAVPPQAVPFAPAIKKEPEISMADSDSFQTPLTMIKEEPNVTIQSCDIPESDLGVIKQELESVDSEPTTPRPTFATGISNTYPLSQTIDSYFDREENPPVTAQPQSMLDSMTGFPLPQNPSYGAYQTVNATQNLLRWNTPNIGHVATAFPIDEAYSNMILNPSATTYSDMLNMPLQRRSPSLWQGPQPGNQGARETLSNDTQLIGQDHTESNDEHSVLVPVGDNFIEQHIMSDFGADSAVRPPTNSTTDTEVLQTDINETSVSNVAIKPEPDFQTGSTVISDIMSDGNRVLQIKTEVVEL